MSGKYGINLENDLRGRLLQKGIQMGRYQSHNAGIDKANIDIAEILIESENRSRTIQEFLMYLNHELIRRTSLLERNQENWFWFDTNRELLVWLHHSMKPVKPLSPEKIKTITKEEKEAVDQDIQMYEERKKQYGFTWWMTQGLESLQFLLSDEGNNYRVNSIAKSQSTINANCKKRSLQQSQEELDHGVVAKETVIETHMRVISTHINNVKRLIATLHATNITALATAIDEIGSNQHPHQLSAVVTRSNCESDESLYGSDSSSVDVPSTTTTAISTAITTTTTTARYVLKESDIPSSIAHACQTKHIFKRIMQLMVNKQKITEGQRSSLISMMNHEMEYRNGVSYNMLIFETQFLNCLCHKVISGDNI